MENKYYTPTIDEFHVGFECEFRERKEYDFIKGVVRASHFMTIGGHYDTLTLEGKSNIYTTQTIHFRELGNFYRVKYLDEQDILECGWKLWHKEGVYEILDKEERNWQMHIGHYADRKDGALALDLYEGVTANSNGQRMFIYCKNKSELKRLMKQLGINE